MSIKIGQLVGVELPNNDWAKGFVFGQNVMDPTRVDVMGFGVTAGRFWEGCSPECVRPIYAQGLQMADAIAFLRQLGLDEKRHDLNGDGAEEWLGKGGDPFGYGLTAADKRLRLALQAFILACEQRGDMGFTI